MAARSRRRARIRAPAPAARLPAHRGRRRRRPARRRRGRPRVGELAVEGRPTSSCGTPGSPSTSAATSSTSTCADWINDGLMAIFFFVVGLEIKRELVDGELREPRRAALPAIAAVGGMLTPGADLRSRSTPAATAPPGWGIPVATDIAMAVGVLSLLGSRGRPVAQAVPPGAGDRRRHRRHRHHRHLLLRRLRRRRAGARRRRSSSRSMVACRPLGVRSIVVYVVLGVGAVAGRPRVGHPRHASPASCSALLTPTRPIRRRELIDADELTDLSDGRARPPHGRSSPASRCRSSSGSSTSCTRGRASSSCRCSPSPTPACRSSADALGDAVSSPITHGDRRRARRRQAGRRHRVHVAGRAARASASCRRASTWRGIVGVGALAGIGFTVSLFVTGLAFDDVALQDEAKIGILVASTIAAVAGSVILLGGSRPRGRAADR